MQSAKFTLIMLTENWYENINIFNMKIVFLNIGFVDCDVVWFTRFLFF